MGLVELHSLGDGIESTSGHGPYGNGALDHFSRVQQANLSFRVVFVSFLRRCVYYKKVRYSSYNSAY